MHKRSFSGTMALVALLTAATLYAADMPKLPEPQQEHAWLQQFVGEWTYESEMTMPGEAKPTKSAGTETVRALGGFWIVADVKGDMMGKPFTGQMTLGYDTDKKQYIATWIDSLTSRLWTYDGKKDGDKKLVLTTEGPCPAMGGKVAKMRETAEIKDANHRTFTSQVMGEDGKWSTMMTATYTRK